MAVAITEPDAAPASRLQPLWHRSAPERLKENCAADGLSSGWKVWQEHLADRKRPERPPFLIGEQPPIIWGWPPEWLPDEAPAMLGSPSALAQRVLDDPLAVAPNLPLALQLLATAYALPRSAEELAADAWWRVVERLHEVAHDAQQQRVDWPGDPADVVRHQLVAGELPLALGYLFPEIRALRALRKPARDALSETLIELTDGQGLPHARLLPVLGPLFACWTRCRWLGERLKRGPWSRDAELQYQWLVRHALRLADGSGRFLLTPDDDATTAWTKPLFKTALELAGDSGDAAAAAHVISRGAVPKQMRNKAAESDLPDPSLNSDWSGIAVLSNGWSQDDVRLVVAYADHPLRIELSTEGERLFAGEWLFETTCDGEAVEIAGEWERLCWESGKRCDYLELAIKLSHGLRLERQLLFARRDRVLYLADIIVAPDGKPRHLQHSASLPLDESASWQAQTETRDGVIIGGKTRAAVLPLALHEWRADPRGGSLDEAHTSLKLNQEAHGRALCCPLLFDLDRKRLRRERTWRQLTVGDWLEVVPRDAAVAFRAQSGPDQWLFYRSLGPVGNRTFLGQNIAGEFSAGRFLSTGKYKEWIEIEAC